MSDINQANSVTSEGVNKESLAANGWILEQQHQSQPFNNTKNAFYVFDNQTGFVYLTSLAVDFSDKAAEELERVSLGELALLITDLVHKVQKKKRLSITDENMLAIALNFYVKRTQSYVAWRAQSSVDQKMHAIVSIYRKRGSEDGEGMLRPIMINSEDIFIHPEDVIMACVKTREIDMANHPEWFMVSHSGSTI